MPTDGLGHGYQVAHPFGDFSRVRSPPIRLPFHFYPVTPRLAVEAGAQFQPIVGPDPLRSYIGKGKWSDNGGLGVGTAQSYPVDGYYRPIECPGRELES